MALVLTRLVRSNYDELDNIPIIHQDLTASFTKQADTYYIHTGSTTSAYTKGRMYYCDGTNLKKVVIVDELPKVNDGKLTITVNGTAYTFTANQSGNTSFSITDTTYTAGTGLNLLNGVFSVKTGYSTNGKNYKVATDTNGNLYVNVPWTDTNTDTHYTNYLQIKGNNTEAVKFTQNADKTLNFKPGTNVSISAAANEITISATDTNTSHSHSAGVGLVGSGSAGTGSGTYSYKAKLRSETALIEDSAAVATVSGRVYPVAVDKSGYLSVNVPWNNTNTATAADDILDGSNSGTQITYAPYTSQQSKLSFDSSNTEPTRSDRLNLNGYLHATKLYSGGKEVLTSYQSIKSLNTNNTTAQDANASEAIVGTGAINLHKIAKTGSYDDLNDKPNRARHSSTQLATNTDLNTLNSSADIGWYHVGGGNSCAHKPTGVDAFGLEVGRSAGGWFYQVLTSSNNAASRGRRFMRTYTGTAWDAWKKVAITSDIPAVHDGTLTIQKNGTAVATFTANSALNTIANIKVPSTFDDLSRIKKQDYAGNNNAVKYFKLATFPVYNSDGNYASFIITGRMGGWESGNTSFVNMILYNRNGEGGGYINVANSSFFNLCDIVMYREADGTSTAYLKVKGYYTFDINVNTYQATNVYTGTDVPPTGTLKWTASANADRLAVSGGKVYVNGFMMPKQVRINDTVRNPDANAVIDLGTVPASYTTSSLTPSKCTKNGFYYVISSINSLTDADGNPFLQYHTSDKDFRILATAYSDSWVQQIATDLRTNHIFYRIRNNGTWGAWQKMMNAEEFTLSGTTLTITM